MARMRKARVVTYPKCSQQSNGNFCKAETKVEGGVSKKEISKTDKTSNSARPSKPARTPSPRALQEKKRAQGLVNAGRGKPARTRLDNIKANKAETKKETAHWLTYVPVMA